MDLTTITVQRDQLCALRDLATGMSRDAGRTVTLREVIGRLISVYAGGGTPAVIRDAPRWPVPTQESR